MMEVPRKDAHTSHMIYMILEVHHTNAFIRCFSALVSYFEVLVNSVIIVY